MSVVRNHVSQGPLVAKMLDKIRRKAPDLKNVSIHYSVDHLGHVEAKIDAEANDRHLHVQKKAENAWLSLSKAVDALLKQVQKAHGRIKGAHMGLG